MEFELLPNINTGVKIQAPLPSDFIAGTETGIEPSIRNVAADWKSFLSTDETQRSAIFDTFACVTFSALNCVEAQMDWMMTQNLIPPPVLQELKDMGFIDEQGHFNASDRFTAKMSGTTHDGNYLTAVWDSIRNDGIIPEKDWQFSKDQAGFNWDAYYAEIPQALKDKGKRFLDLFETRYQWLFSGDKSIESLKTWLQLAPIQICTAVCPPWNTSQTIPACSLNVGHATMVYCVNNGVYDIEDHYYPYQKHLALDYPIPFALQGVVKLKEAWNIVSPPIEAPTVRKHDFSVTILYGSRGTEVVALQDALKKDGVFPKNVLSTGFYGNITRIAVITFQKKYRVASPQEIAYLNGKTVGPKTRAQLNKLFNQ